MYFSYSRFFLLLFVLFVFGGISLVVWDVFHMRREEEDLDNTTEVVEESITMAIGGVYNANENKVYLRQLPEGGILGGFDISLECVSSGMDDISLIRRYPSRVWGILCEDSIVFFDIQKEIVALPYSVIDFDLSKDSLDSLYMGENLGEIFFVKDGFLRIVDLESDSVANIVLEEAIANMRILFSSLDGRYLYMYAGTDLYRFGFLSETLIPLSSNLQGAKPREEILKLIDQEHRYYSLSSDFDLEVIDLSEDNIVERIDLAQDKMEDRNIGFVGTNGNFVIFVDNFGSYDVFSIQEEDTMFEIAGNGTSNIVGKEHVIALKGNKLYVLDGIGTEDYSIRSVDLNSSKKVLETKLEEGEIVLEVV